MESENETKRTRKIPSKYDDYELYMAFDAMAYVQQVPTKVEELKDRNDERFWRGAMKKEIELLRYRLNVAPEMYIIDG